jgi:hypothetical protein
MQVAWDEHECHPSVSWMDLDASTCFWNGPREMATHRRRRLGLDLLLATNTSICFLGFDNRWSKSAKIWLITSDVSHGRPMPFMHGRVMASRLIGQVQLAYQRAPCTSPVHRT